MRNTITIQSVSTIFISVSADLETDHGRQTWGKTEQEVVGDQEEPLYHNEGLVPQEVSQEEDGEKEGQVGVCPDREQVVGHLWVREDECLSSYTACLLHISWSINTEERLVSYKCS